MNNTGNSITSQLLTHSGDNLQKAHELTAELPKSDSEEAVALNDDKIDLNKRNETQQINATAEAITNVTAVSIVDEKMEKENCKLLQVSFTFCSITIVYLYLFIVYFTISYVYKKKSINIMRTMVNLKLSISCALLKW